MKIFTLKQVKTIVELAINKALSYERNLPSSVIAYNPQEVARVMTEDFFKEIDWMIKQKEEINDRA